MDKAQQQTQKQESLSTAGMSLKLKALLVASLPLLLSSCIELQNAAVESRVGTPTQDPAQFEVKRYPEIPPEVGNGTASSAQSNTQSSQSSAQTATPIGDSSQTTTVMPPQSEEIVLPIGFSIEGLIAGKYAKEASVELKFQALEMSEMKVSFDGRCESGVWEPIKSQARYPVSKLNSPLTVSVVYRDFDQVETPCLTRSFIQDALGPEILFQKYPSASVEEGSTGEIIFSVGDAAGVQQVTCALNGKVQPCLTGSNAVTISAMPEGVYSFLVRAVDSLGNSSEKSIEWSVVSSVRYLSQDVKVDEYRKVDVVFVIDNSGSMAYEQQSMAKRTANFLSILRGLDWQVAITTTDPRPTATGGDGQFVTLTGGNPGEWILDSRMNEKTAQDRLSQTLQRKETGSGTEQGIRAVYRVVERWQANDNKARTLVRDGAQLAAVLISDEDESANTVKNDPHELMKLVNQAFGGQKRFNFHSIVTKSGDRKCQTTYGATFGLRYEALSNLTGGLIGSVCEMDYAAQVQGIAERVRNLLKTLTLECAPVAGRPVVVYRDGVVYPGAFKNEGLNLLFETELLPGAYTIKYQCLR
jgi:hypothetical protein